MVEANCLLVFAVESFQGFLDVLDILFEQEGDPWVDFILVGFHPPILWEGIP